jgi:glycosyltransferase involved in cell wall biosynthesis
MRIAIIGPDFPPTTGGEAEYAAQVAAALHRRGHRVVVFSRVGNIGRDGGYEVRDVLRGRQWGDRQSLTALAEFDVVHAMNAAWCWVSTFGKPTFLSIHGNDFISPNPVYGYDIKTRFNLPKGDGLDLWLAQRRTRAMMNECLLLCRSIFANSDYTKREFLSRYPACDGKVVKAGVGVGALFVGASAPMRTRGPAPSMLTVCRLSEPRKNVDLVLRALARLKSDFGFRYTVVGEGDQKWALTQLAAELGLADRVRFTGRVADAELRSHYQGADLFVLPSGASSTSFEGFGIVYLEANAMGVPTMALRAAGAAEAVDEGRSGFFVEREDIVSIQAGLRSFLSGERVFRVEDCRKFAARFSWADIVGTFECAYEGALRSTETTEASRWRARLGI